MEQPDRGSPFSTAERVRSFTHAGRGVYLFFASTQNAWIHGSLLLGATILGFALDISKGDWLALILAAGLVFTAEAINSAIEIHMNLTSPEHHPHARDTKDVAAGAVLLASLVALAVGCFIFLPPLLA